MKRYVPVSASDRAVAHVREIPERNLTVASKPSTPHGTPLSTPPAAAGIRPPNDLDALWEKYQKRDPSALRYKQPFVEEPNTGQQYAVTEKTPTHFTVEQNWDEGFAVATVPYRLEDDGTLLVPKDWGTFSMMYPPEGYEDNIQWEETFVEDIDPLTLD